MALGIMAKTLDIKIRSLPGVVATRSRWKHETAYLVGGREFVHFHSPNEIDIRLTKTLETQNRQRLNDDPRVKLRPRSSDWIAIVLRTDDDVKFAFGLVKLAWRANGVIQATKRTKLDSLA